MCFCFTPKCESLCLGYEHPVGGISARVFYSKHQIAEWYSRQKEINLNLFLSVQVCMNLVLVKEKAAGRQPPILAFWQQRPQWQVLDKTIVLFDFVCVGHLTEILQRACCQWSGVPPQMTKTTPGLCSRDLFRNQKSTAAGWLHHSWALPFLPSSSLASERPSGKGV